MSTHILSFLTKAEMDPIPGALTPGLADFFDPPTDLTPFDPKLYQSTQGCLIFYCLVRANIQLFVHHLSASNHHPTQSNRNRQIHVMRNLKSYPSIGPAFFSNPLVRYGRCIIVSNRFILVLMTVSSYNNYMIIRISDVE
jgi:hypothetical protein